MVVSFLGIIRKNKFSSLYHFRGRQNDVGLIAEIREFACFTLHGTDEKFSRKRVSLGHLSALVTYSIACSHDSLILTY